MRERFGHEKNGSRTRSGGSRTRKTARVREKRLAHEKKGLGARRAVRGREEPLARHPSRSCGAGRRCERPGARLFLLGPPASRRPRLEAELVPPQRICGCPDRWTVDPVPAPRRRWSTRTSWTAAVSGSRALSISS